MRERLERAGFDARFSSLVIALAAIWLLLALATDGIFVSPRNLYNLSIQTCVTAIMACGMVYIIVARQIDLSVGSMMACIGMVIAWAQIEWLGAETPGAWAVSIIVGIACGMLLGAFQGWWTAYREVPAFVVTLAGYLMFRGAAFLVADGQTLAPLANTFQRIGGGVNGSIGPGWSWALGIAACLVVIARAVAARRSRIRYQAALTPLWADALKVGVVCVALLGFVAVVCAYPDPASAGAGGTPVGKGIGMPVLILAAVAALLTGVAQRTRFGRYVFAYGGNPEAALLSGLPTRRVLLMLFMLMGALAAVAAMITTSRLNSGTHSIGQMAELYVIAATVIGGTSLAGGTGTIPGAIVGALLIQSLDNGMVLMDVGSAKRQIFIGLILIGAVWFDVVYSRGSAVSATLGAGAAGAAAAGPLVVEVHGLCKHFGGIQAVDKVDCNLHAGEVVGLLGHNGAGKSTLIKVLSGVYPADAGQIVVHGVEHRFGTPRDARAAGIETIHQTLALAENLDAPSNLFLGRELLTRWRTLDMDRMEHEALQVISRLNPNFRDMRKPVRAMSGGQRQTVAIARALYFNARILIMDEPCAALGPAETRMVLDTILRLKAEGIAIFLISHDMADVFEVCDRATVMKNGAVVDTVRVADVTQDEVLGMIILGQRPKA